MTIPVRDKKSDIQQEVARGNKLHARIKTLAEEAANESIDSSKDLDEVIAAISKRESFNRLQIQRLIEESNTVTYNKRYDKLRNVNDRRIEFSLASLEGVVQEMGSDAPEEIENPNFATGARGVGSMNKAASVESRPIHNPNSNLEQRKEKYDKRMETMNQRRLEKEAAQQEKERNSLLFKIANSIVMSERQYKNGNQIFNTMLDDVGLGKEEVDGITKRASDISSALVERRRCHKGFMVTLEQNQVEKVANHLLGDYSLLKEAENNNKVEPIKVQPTADVADFEELINLARRLEQQQKGMNTIPATAENEVK